MVLCNMLKKKKKKEQLWLGECETEGLDSAFMAG